MLNKNETSNTVTLLVQVYLNYFHSTGTQQAAEQKRNFWLELSEVSKSRDSSNRYFTEASTHSTLLFYISHFFKRKTDKETSKFHVSFSFQR